MTWQALIPIIVQYGLPLAESIWKKWQSNEPIKQEDWDELKALSKQTARTQLIDALTRAGIPLDSPQAVELLKQVPQ